MCMVLGYEVGDGSSNDGYEVGCVWCGVTK